MKNKFCEALKALNLKENEKNVTVALSGGKDSMALLNLLLSVKDEFDINVYAAHFNHLLRGEESFRDEEFVISECKRLGVPLTLERGDVELYAKQNKLGIETAARDLRYAFFSKVNKGVVATAHTASDNVETLLLNIIRGSGLDGACGIPERRDIFIRPLIAFSTDEILDYCKQNNISFVTDSTNLSDICARNFLRNNVITSLKLINPSLEDSVIRLLGSLKKDRDFIENSAEALYRQIKTEKGVFVGSFSEIEEALASRIIIKFLNENGFSVSLERVELIKNVIYKKSKITLDNNISVEVKDDFLCVVKKNGQKITFNTEIIEKNADFLYKDGKINNLLLKNAIDCDKIVGILKVRTRLEGDSISFAHRKLTKPLRKLFSEDCIDKELRDKIPVIADDLGVVWVYSYGVDKRVCPDENTRKVYTVNCKKILG